MGFLAAAALMALTLAPAGSASMEESAGRFEVQGHRGARSARPENTLSAFRYALEAGVDALEMDLVVTKDDVPVVLHDHFVNPELCLDSKGRRLKKPVLVRRLSLRELKSYDCGSLVNPRFPRQVPQPAERIPTFEEVLVWLARTPDARARRVRLNVETKIEPAHPERAPAPEAFAKLVLDAMRKHRVLERSTLQSFDFRTLIAARAIEPGIAIAALIEERPEEALTQIASRLGADIISPRHVWLTAADVVALHREGVKVIPWTANAQEEWRRLVDMGVDAIITDDPKALLEFRRVLRPL